MAAGRMLSPRRWLALLGVALVVVAGVMAAALLVDVRLLAGEPGQPLEPCGVELLPAEAADETVGVSGIARHGLTVGPGEDRGQGG